MKNIITLLLLAFFSTVVFANDPSNDDTIAATSANQEILVASIGFDKVLSLILIDIEAPSIEIAFSQGKEKALFKTTLMANESGVIEMDLNDFQNGTYSLEILAGDYTEVFTIILP